MFDRRQRDVTIVRSSRSMNTPVQTAVSAHHLCCRICASTGLGGGLGEPECTLEDILTKTEQTLSASKRQLGRRSAVGRSELPQPSGLRRGRPAGRRP